MGKSINYEMFEKFFLNKGDEKEVNEILMWINDRANSEEIQFMFGKLWDSLDNKTIEYQSNAKFTLDAIHKKISEYEHQKSIDQARQSSVRSRYHRFQIYQVAKIAAIIIICILIGGIYLFKNKDVVETAFYNQVVVSDGETARTLLMDGSEIKLNSGSVLKYANDYGMVERKVFLQGEAYFNISKDLQKPFKVETSDLEIIVTGTRFNLSAYGNEQTIETTLEEGSVKIINKLRKNDIVALKPGDKASFTKSSGIIKVNKVNTLIYTSWQNGIYRFENEQLDNLCKKIERWYGIKIVIENENIKKRQFTGEINKKQQSIDEVLKILVTAAPIQYYRKENVIYIKNKN